MSLGHIYRCEDCALVHTGSYRPGQRVRITQGPYAGKEGTFVDDSCPECGENMDYVGEAAA